MNEFDPLNYHTIADTVVAALLLKSSEPLPPDDSFPGAGVYLIYYTGKFKPYQTISKTDTPVYAGKAIPPGGRRGSAALKQIEHTKTPVLLSRLRDHAQSIDSAKNLELSDFRCRYLVVRPIWITIAESLLIEKFNPIWNAVVDGFGLHDPGSTRYGQRRSDWDTLHPGRPWSPKMKDGNSMDQIKQEIIDHFLNH